MRRWSLDLGELLGVRVIVHWTFYLLIAYIVFAGMLGGSPLPQIAETVLFILVVFGCVVLHELGHALAARMYGIHTKDITLLPIGGVARLERMPEKPVQELVVALAGPAVNVAIAAVLFALLLLLGGLGELMQLSVLGGAFLPKLLFVNVMLVAFNLLPAFPMDGGRIFRAMLATQFDYVKATRWAVRVGQGMAILFGILGIVTGHFLLVLVAMFVFLGASSEGQAVETRSRLRGLRVRDAMASQFQTLSPGDSLHYAVWHMQRSFQDDFPVVDGGRLQGILRREDVRQAVLEGKGSQWVGDVCRTNFPVLSPDDSLEEAFLTMQARGFRSLPVVDGNHVVGLVSMRAVEEWLSMGMLTAALSEDSPSWGSRPGAASAVGFRE